MKQLSLSLSLLIGLSISSCKNQQPSEPLKLAAQPDDMAPRSPPAKLAPPPAPPVGMLDPFSHLSNQATKPFNSGWAAFKAKKYEESAALFSEVNALLPDHLGARLQAARAYLLAANAVATREQLEALISRNFIAYGSRPTDAKEFAPFRTSPEWPLYKQSEERLRAAYAQGLSQGLIFVARSGSVEPPSFSLAKPGEKAEAKLELRQEVYHFDPESNRYRPLTATDGHVLMAIRSPDGKRLAFLTAFGVQRDEDKTWFFEPQFGFLDLSTLETAGPIKLGGGHEELVIGFGQSGTPLVLTTGAIAKAGEGLGAGTYELDTARTGLAKAASDAELKGERVYARYLRLWHGGGPTPPEVTLSEDRHSIKLGTSGLITSARTLAEGSLSYSPAQRYFLYAGQFDACAAEKDDKAKAAQNELFVYEVEKKAAARIDAGPSAFTAVWLRDDLLAYENDSGAKATLNLFDLAARKKTTLPLRHGAGLYGLPTLFCAATAATPSRPVAPTPVAPTAKAAPDASVNP